MSNLSECAVHFLVSPMCVAPPLQWMSHQRVKRLSVHTKGLASAWQVRTLIIIINRRKGCSHTSGAQEGLVKKVRAYQRSAHQRRVSAHQMEVSTHEKEGLVHTKERLVHTKEGLVHTTPDQGARWGWLGEKLRDLHCILSIEDVSNWHQLSSDDEIGMI